MAVAVTVVAAMGVCAGCAPETGAVLMRLEQRSADFSGGSSYNSSATEVVFAPDGHVFFAASSNLGELHVTLDQPLAAQTTFPLPLDHESVQFRVGDGVWGNQGGSVFVISVDPAIIRLVAVPMVPRAGVAAGTFELDGDGTFR